MPTPDEQTQEAEKVEQPKAGEPQGGQTSNNGETLEQLKARLSEIERHAKNKEEEAERNRKKLEKFEKDEEARKLAELSEIDKVKKLLEKADAERQRVELELKTERERNAILAEATKLGFINPEQAYKLLDRDAEGNIPSGALAKLAKDSPYLLKQESAPGTPKPGVKPTKDAQKPIYPVSRY